MPYAQPLYKDHKESADKHKRGWGHWAETKQKERVDVFLTPQGELVCFGFIATSYHRTRPCKSHNVVPAAFKAITLCSVLRHRLFFH